MATVAEPTPQEHVRHTKTRANFVEKSETGRKRFAENAKEQTVRKKMVNNVVITNWMANNIGMLAKAAVGETENSMIWSQQPVTLQRKTPLSPMTGMRKIKLKVDTGEHTPLRIYKQMYKTLPPKDILEPTRNFKLVAYNGQEIPCLGSINLQLRFGKRKEKEKNFTKAKFYLVDVPSAPIVGLQTCEQIGLVTIDCDDLRPKPDVTTVEGLKQAYPGQFDTLGDFKCVAKFHLKQDCEPFIDPPRKCSIHLREKLNCELKKMEKQGVIRKVSEHTDWCSSRAYSVKKDGSLRVCTDPQKLNQALKRCPHNVPTFEELNPQFSGSTGFSKLDAKAGYWSIHLGPDSQLITTAGPDYHLDSGCHKTYSKPEWTKS